LSLFEFDIILIQKLNLHQQ